MKCSTQGLFALAALFLFLAAAPAPLRAAEETPLSGEVAEKALASLRAEAAKLTSLRASFVQEKQLALFKQTMRSEGVLAFRRPDSLRWEYQKPVPSGFLISKGKGFTWSSAGGTQSKGEIKESREFSALAEQIMLWLAFDEAKLRTQYQLDVLSVSPLTIRLTPHNEAMRNFLADLTLVFVPGTAAAKEVRIREGKGDTMLLRFNDPEINTPLPDSLFTP